MHRRFASALAFGLAMHAGCITYSARQAERCEGMAFAANCGDAQCRGDETAENCPADCVEAHVTSYNAQTICTEVERLVEPTTTAEVQAAVRAARAEGLHVRVIGRTHTSNAQLCTDGVVVSTAKLNRALHIERFEGVETVVTEPGIRYGDLTQWLDDRGRSLGFAVLGTRDPTIAGAIATGSHGSSPRHTSVISTLLESVEIVDANGDVREYTRSATPERTWKTLTAGLGLAGIATKLRLRIEPTFNLDVQVSYHSDTALGTGAGPIDYVRECDYGQLVWFPGRKRVVKMCGIKTALPPELGATNRLLLPDFKRWVSGPAERALHYGTCNDHFNCATLERARYRQFVREPPFYRKMAADQEDRSFHQVVGRGSRMMSSELTLAQDGILQHDFEFALPPSRAAAAYAAAREYFARDGICLPLVGVFIRFSKIEDEAWIAHTSASESFAEGGFVTFFGRHDPLRVHRSRAPGCRHRDRRR
ncbi:MAG: FAD-binding oxidoreductase, partial [Myxococcota bacterium]